MWHDSFICVTWLIHMCDMTHSYMWHDSFIYVTWLIHICNMTQSDMLHDSFIYVTWLNHAWHNAFICDMHHISFICIMSRIWIMARIWHIWMRHASIYSCVCQDSFLDSIMRNPILLICVACRIHVCAMTHSYVCHDSFICVTWSIWGGYDLGAP